MTSIIRSRLERALRIGLQTSANAQKRHPGRRRKQSYRKGEIMMEAGVRVKLPAPLLARLDALCTAQRVNRSVVLRDALDVYLGIAEQEGLLSHPVPTVVRPL